jgi:hypothetical protein
MYTSKQIISWMPHGRAWKIHNRELLMTEVVPKYFTMNKYQSFQRQINGWGFKLLYQSGNDKGAYYHEYFIRGMPHLLVLIQRVPPKEKMKVLKYKSSKDEEPNFYMDPLQPLFMQTTLSPCPNKSDQESLSEDMSITPIPYGNRPKLALHYDTNQPAPHRYHPTTMTNIHDLPNQQHQVTHPLQHQNNDWMCSVENDYEQQSTVRHVSEKNDGLNNDTMSKVDAVLQAFMKRSFERHNINVEYVPTIASANGSAEGAHHYWNNDCASMIPCSCNDAAVEKNEEEMVAHSVVRHEEDSRRVSHEAQDKPIETSWLCRPCKNID